jgi:DNA-binding response OmpR family regulator
VDGFTFCQELVSDQNFRRIPIVMISGRGEVSDIVFGLNSGADDYVAKPINVVELKARIDACLRRAAKSNPMAICFDNIELNPEQHSCVLQEESGPRTIMLTPTEFRLIFILLNQRGKSLSREDLTRRLWVDHDAVIDARSIDSHVSRIRKKLGTLGNRLVCTHGRGYAFVDPGSA